MNLDLVDDPVRSASLQSVDPRSDVGRSYSFLKSVSQNADSFAIAVIDTYGDMPLNCLRMFFNFSTNVYLPWTISATAGGRRDQGPLVADAPYPSFPSKLLKDHSGLFQPINYPSYRVYNREAQYKPFIADGTNSRRIRRPPAEATDASKDVVSQDFLGPMLVWPFRVGLDSQSGVGKGVFSVSGFLRMMGRYEAPSCSRTDWDRYETDQFPKDVIDLRPHVTNLTEYISLVLARKRS